MRLTVAVSLILTAIALLLPLASPEAPEDIPGEISEAEPAPPFYAPPARSFDDAFTFLVLDGGEARETSMSEYVFGALGAEMPASFELEALKAQAVAIRSYALSRIASAPGKRHPEAAVCTDSSCCAAYKSTERLREKWGSRADEYEAKLREAIAATDGLALFFDGEPALSVFHSSSAGRTEASGEIWPNALPYLVSVESPEGVEVPNYVRTVEVSADEFRGAILARYPEAKLDGEASTWLGEAEYAPSGRVRSWTIGGVSIPGTALRSMFSLRSTAIELAVDGDSVVMTSTGYGHGVGMSQYGANALAASGEDYTAILERYYPGTEIVRAEAFTGS